MYPRSFIGVGRGDWFRSPSLRTGLAVFPHPALQSVVLPASGLTNRCMGCDKGEQPLFGKEGVGPAVVIVPASASFPAMPAPQNASQPRPDQSVQRCERVAVAMLEVRIPPARTRVHSCDYGLQTLPIAASGLFSNRTFDLVQALLARCLSSTF